MLGKFSLLLSFIVFLFPAAAFSQSPEIINQAKKEGEVILYSTMSVGDFTVFEKYAREKYPFLNIRHIYLASGRQAARVMQEFRAGRVQADVLGNSPEPLLYFKQQGVLGQYRSPEAKNLLPGAWDPEGYSSGITTDLLLTGFNPRLISRAAAPKNYDDYLKPQFKGQIAVNRSTPYPLTGMISLLGEEQGLAYFKKFSQQEPRLIEGYSHNVNLLTAGEFPITGFMQISKLEGMKRKQAPVDWLPCSPTLATSASVAMVKNPLHPASAQLLIDAYLSAEGQRGLAIAGKIPVRRGIKSPSADIDQLLESGNLHFIRPDGNYDRYMKLYGEFLATR